MTGGFFFEKLKCSDFHENLHLNQFLCVESISEFRFPKNEFQVNFQKIEFLEDVLEILKICMEKQMQISWNYAEMSISCVR